MQNRHWSTIGTPIQYKEEKRERSKKTMSGHASYDDAFDTKYGYPHKVPLLIADEKTLRGYGNIVRCFEDEEIEITTWPQQGWRPVEPGTGKCGGIRSDNFVYNWEGEFLKAWNRAVPNGQYVTGRLPRNVEPNNRTSVLVREANYHPDGGQLFFPQNGDAFVALLALPTDDVTPEHFRAFYCDGTFGIQIHANIWHQPVYPIADNATFLGKQGAVHACMVVDFPKEFGKYLSVPLRPEK
ncbi:hypothetical protein ScPMuIL_006234 [Solemya velum]